MWDIGGFVCFFFSCVAHGDGSVCLSSVVLVGIVPHQVAPLSRVVEMMLPCFKRKPGLRGGRFCDGLAAALR